MILGGEVLSASPPAGATGAAAAGAAYVPAVQVMDCFDGDWGDTVAEVLE